MRISNAILAFGLCALVGCSPIHQWPAVRASSGPYIDPGNEFSVDLPAEIASINSTTTGRVRVVDFVVTNIARSQDWYSVEWTTLKPGVIQSPDEFFASWDNFLPKYLEKNFGNGHYTVKKVERSTFGAGQPSLRFVGAGINNGGGTGVIYGTAIGFGDRVAVLYLIQGQTIDESKGFQDLPGYPNYARFVSSLKRLNVGSGK